MSNLTPRTNSDTSRPHHRTSSTSSPCPYGARYASLGAGVGLGVSGGSVVGVSPSPALSGISIPGPGSGGGSVVGRHAREGSGMQAVRVRTASVVSAAVGIGAHVREGSGVCSSSSAIHPSSYGNQGHGQHVREGSGLRRAHPVPVSSSYNQGGYYGGDVDTRRRSQSFQGGYQPGGFSYGTAGGMGGRGDREGGHNSRHGPSRAFTPPTPVVDDKYWVEGDFELVTSDGVRFRVPSYYLFAASAIFREAGVLDPDPDPTRERGEADDIEMLAGMDDIDGMDHFHEMDAAPPSHSRSASYARALSHEHSECPSARPTFGHLPGVVHARYLRLSDPTETASVLRLFLTFSSTGHLPIPDDGTTLDSLETLRALVLFLRKYECDPTLALALTVLREAVRQPSSVSPLAAFVAGASASDAFTCSVALDVTDWTWRMMDRRDLPSAPDANVFDPHHMPVAVWQLIPPMYTWALTTAWTGEGRDREQGFLLWLALKRFGVGSECWLVAMNEARHRAVKRRTASAVQRDREDYDDDARSRRSASRCDSGLGRRVHAWQQWL